MNVPQQTAAPVGKADEPRKRPRRGKTSAKKIATINQMWEEHKDRTIDRSKYLKFDPDSLPAKMGFVDTYDMMVFLEKVMQEAARKERAGQSRSDVETECLAEQAECSKESAEASESMRQIDTIKRALGI
jgi:hypothetical protein